MIIEYYELIEWYKTLSEYNKLELWQNFSTYMNNTEIKNCIKEVKKGKKDLFEIHWKLGYIEKYQIYFNQIVGKM